MDCPNAEARAECRSGAAAFRFRLSLTAHRCTCAQVACPTPLPGGMSIQIIDCAGAQLSMVSAGTIAAFRVRARLRVAVVV